MGGKAGAGCLLAVVAATVCAAPSGGAAGAASAPEHTTGVAVVGGSTQGPRRGLLVEAQAATSSLRRVGVRFERGVAIHVKRRAVPYTFARYFLGSGRDSKELGGRLLVPAGKGSGRIRLRFRPIHNGFTQPAPVTAVLRTGGTPSLVISGLPRTALWMELFTKGAGSRGTRATVCENDEVRYSGSMRIRLRSGVRVTRDVSGGFTC